MRFQALARQACFALFVLAVTPGVAAAASGDADTAAVSAPPTPTRPTAAAPT